MQLGVATDFGTSTGRDWAKSTAELGASAVVFPITSDSDDEKIKSYVSAAKEYNLCISEVGIWRNAIDPDGDAAKANLEYSIRQLALADAIGARCCVNIVGAYGGNRWDGAVKENYSKEAFQKSVKMIQTVIDEVNPKNTYFTIEPMPWMIPSSPEEYLQLLDAVERDRFAVHMDIINMINTPERYFFPEEFLDKTFSLLKGKIKSCHIKDVRLLDDFTFQLKECACGEGTFPLEYYAKLASLEDPDMPMIIEHLPSVDQYLSNFKYLQNRLSKEA